MKPKSRVIANKHFSRQSSLEKALTNVNVAFFLAVREIKRSNWWTTLLIIFVMMITFLNMVFVSGILIGLVEGSVDKQKQLYTGDVIISRLREKNYIEKSREISQYLHSLPEVRDVSSRYIEGGLIEANYKNKDRATDITDSASALIAGIDPESEDAVTGLSKVVIEGEYLSPGDYDKILVGSSLLYKYNPIDTPSMRTLPNVGVGTKVRLTVGGFSREVTVKGILKSKIGEVDSRVFMTDAQLRNLIGRGDLNVDEIAVKEKNGRPETSDHIKDHLLNAGYDSVAKIQTSVEAQPKFLKDMKATFGLLGNLIGGIGIVVASITIFIIIFVNAITRRKFIGIMKGIGIRAPSIEMSYVLQACFYGIIGSALGLIVIFGFLKPYFDANPINFPFSDGILSVTGGGVAIRVVVLMISTVIAGYIPAKIVVRQNTLDAILGR
ncbi:MAG: FtsX-like permease family protein [Candidatus Paceibacterota bacterium]|jgi:ABC-type lipoprotein release transport system permease subunit|nr:FtsX-like permease family protein [Candidatus Paceibacterota bacterium]